MSIAKLQSRTKKAFFSAGSLVSILQMGSEGAAGMRKEVIDDRERAGAVGGGYPPWQNTAG